MTPLPCDSVLASRYVKVKEEAMRSIAEATQTLATEYNGWTNRETWVVNLWLSNDMESYELLQGIYKKPCETREKAEKLEVHFQDQLEGR